MRRICVLALLASAVSIPAISLPALADPLQVTVYPYGNQPVYVAQQGAPQQVYYYVQQPRYAAAPAPAPAPGYYGRSYPQGYAPNYAAGYAPPQTYAPPPQGYVAAAPQSYAPPVPQGYAAPAPQRYAAPAPQGYAAPPPQAYAAAAPAAAPAVAPPVAPPPASSSGGFLQAIFGGPTINVPVSRVYPAYQAPQPQPPAVPPLQQASYNPTNPTDESNYPIDPTYMRQVVAYNGDEKPGTIIVDTPDKFLYLVEDGGRALRYGIGVGRPGFTWSGVKTITAMKKWPDWTPPPEMIARQPEIPHFMPGGLGNPLGSRALYLGSTLYRIHGSNEPWTIGHDVSSGCIRMRNADVEDLYGRVHVGTKVVVM